MDQDFHQIAGVLALGLLLPAWLVFGFLDWRHHRKTHIETTSGWRESGLHLLLISQAGLAVLAALFLEVNALILALAIALTWRTRSRQASMFTTPIHAARLALRNNACTTT